MPKILNRRRIWVVMNGSGIKFCFRNHIGVGRKRDKQSLKMHITNTEKQKKRKNYFKIIAQTVAEVLSEIVSEQFTIHAISKLRLKITVKSCSVALFICNLVDKTL